MLIRAFEVHVGGELKFGPGLKHRVPRASRLEPDIEDVFFLAEIFGEKPGG